MPWWAALLVLLGAAPAGAEPPPDAVLADLPFLESGERGRIHLDLAPEGSRRRLPMLLDTGANVSLMTPRVARALGVRVRRTKSDPYRRATRLGRDLLFYVDTRRSDTGSPTGLEYGVLGGDFLAEYVLELDFRGRRVRFIDRDRYALPTTVEAADEAVLPIRVVGNRPALRVAVNGQELELLIDTGAPLGLILSGKLARAAGVESAPDARVVLAGVQGALDTEVGVARRVRIGPFVFEDVPVAVAPKGWFNLGYPGDSMLGYDLLARFRVRIDYAARRLWLRRDPDAALTPRVPARGTANAPD